MTLTIRASMGFNEKKKTKAIDPQSTIKTQGSRKGNLKERHLALAPNSKMRNQVLLLFLGQLPLEANT